jgi:hypothetical protein
MISMIIQNYNYDKGVTLLTIIFLSVYCLLYTLIFLKHVNIFSGCFIYSY